jgi:hypothetical protein
MNKNNGPIIKPINTGITQYHTKQSKYDNAAVLPCRSVVLGPSGSGKTVLLTNMILDIYKNCFSRIYIFSPSINVDSVWIPVKKYIEHEMKIDTKKEQCYFEEYNVHDLKNIIDTQHQIIEFMKSKKDKNLFQILIIIDDMADNPKLCRNSQLLNSLYIRGRHNQISTITSVQKLRSLSTIIRVNTTELYIYRLRNYKEIESLVEELSALYPKKIIFQIYNLATESTHSFLYIKLTEHNKKDMFYKNLTEKIIVDSDSD